VAEGEVKRLPLEGKRAYEPPPHIERKDCGGCERLASGRIGEIQTG
jgi:hypothetical protein